MEPWISIVVTLLYVYIFVTTIYLLLENRENSTTLAWLLVFIFVPFFGVVLYFLFGKGTKKKIRNYIVPQNLEGRIQDIDSRIVEKQKKEMESLGSKYLSTGHVKLMRLLYRNSHSILTRRNNVDVFFRGKDKFDILLDDFEKAEKYIHMEYFI